MNILSLLSVLVIFLGNILVFPGLAHAQNNNNLVFAPEIAAFAGIGILQIFIALFLFLFIPIAFIGMILRLLGFKKEGEGEGWRWNLKQALFRFLKYLLYHIGLFGLWLIILQDLTGSSYIDPDPYGYGAQNPLQSAQLLINVLINGYLILFLIYAIAWAFVGPYIVYLWHKMRGKPTFKPSFGSHGRLALWNILIFFGAGLVFSILFGY